MIKFDTVSQLRSELPKRDDFLSSRLKPVISNRVKRRLPINFLANDFMEDHISIDRQHKYVIYLFGILPDGSKTTVILENIDVYYDIRVPENMTKEMFKSEIRTLLFRADLSPDNMDIAMKYPFHGYWEEKQPYLRLFYNAYYNYKKSLKYILEETQYETSSNDRSCYYRKVGREYKYNTAGQNIVKNYVVDTSGRYANTKYVLRVDINNFKPYEVQNDDANCLKRESVIKCGWDIEAYTIPSERDGFVYVDRPDRDSVFMICMSFNFYHDPTPIYDVTITTMPCTDKKDAPTILCKKESELFTAMAVVLGNMKPELITGFNDGGYDFPMIFNRMTPEQHNFWKREISCIPATDNNLKYNIRGRHVERKIKISAEMYIDREVFKVPGMIVFDTQMVFQKLFPTAEGKSLDFFLKKCRLPLKNEMAISHMFKLLDILYEAENLLGSQDHPLMNLDEFLNAVSEANYDPGQIEKLRELDDVREYCRVDARRCPELCCVRTVIGDTKEKSSMSYTSLYDGLYRADGMKVRNLAMSRGYDRDIVFNTIGNQNRKVKNYPGGFVFPPKKGLKKFTQAEKIKIKIVSEFPELENLPNLNVRPIHDAKSAEETLTTAGFTKVINRWLELMKTVEYDRPATGLDFSSLYPSLIRTYNFSPDKCIKDPNFAEKMDPNDIMPVKFEYERYTPDGGSEFTSTNGWFVRHNNDESKMGLYVTILGNLYDRRSKIKKIMLMLNSVAEFMETNNDGDTISMETLIEIANAKVSEAEADPDLKSDHKRTRNRAKWKLFSMGQIRDYLVEHKSEKFHPLLHDVEFEAMKLNSKQLALKLFMNTFYGEAGNQISPFYELLVSGSICNRGQYNIKLVDAKVRELDCGVNYGDTDSVYVSSPHSVFKDADHAYAVGEIEREEYWTQLVDITMDNIDEVKVTVNEMLMEDNGSPYLKVAYEEVLWPVYLAAKKKYFGNPHENLIQKSLWYSMDMSVEDFTKKLFLRGMDAKKRGSSGFLKECCFGLWRELMDIRYRDDAMTTTIRYMDKIMSTDWTNRGDLFSKRSRYKKPAPGMPGNVSVLTFIKRMKERNVPIPEVGDRFSYILVKPKGPSFDLRGRKIPNKVGDNMEFPDALDKGYEINLDYYMMNEIVGQFARTIVYHDMFKQIGNSDDEDSEEGSDAGAIRAAKQFLTKYYKQKYLQVMQVPKEYKQTFRNVNKVVMNQCDKVFGGSTGVLKGVNVTFTGSDKIGNEFNIEIRKALDTYIQKQSKKLANEHDVELSKYLRKKSTQLDSMRKIYNNKIGGVIQTRRKLYDRRRKDAYQKLISYSTKFTELCDKLRGTVKDIINNNFDVELDSIKFDNINDEDKLVIQEMNQALSDVIAYDKCLEEDRLLVKRMELIEDVKLGAVIPSKKEKHSFAKPMQQFMKDNATKNMFDISGS